MHARVVFVCTVLEASSAVASGTVLAALILWFGTTHCLCVLTKISLSLEM